LGQQQVELSRFRCKRGINQLVALRRFRKGVEKPFEQTHIGIDPAAHQPFTRVAALDELGQAPGTILDEIEGIDIAFAGGEALFEVALQVAVDCLDDIARRAVELAGERFGLARQSARQLRLLGLAIRAIGGLRQGLARARPWRRFVLDTASQLSSRLNIAPLDFFFLGAGGPGGRSSGPGAFYFPEPVPRPAGM
jgi:hypothetical protein